MDSQSVEIRRRRISLYLGLSITPLRNILLTTTTLTISITNYTYEKYITNCSNEI